MAIFSKSQFHIQRKTAFEQVTERDWFETEHLTTVAVIVPRGADKEFVRRTLVVLS